MGIVGATFMAILDFLGLWVSSCDGAFSVYGFDLDCPCVDFFLVYDFDFGVFLLLLF